MGDPLEARGTIRPTAGRPQPRTAPLVAIGVFLGIVVLVGLIAFFQGAA
jgi:hypothetical protein